MSLIDLKNIHFSYRDGQKILNGLDMRLAKGQRVVLVGGNGAGKTTLFHIILGLLKPDKGTVALFGRECSSERDFRGPRRHIGLLFQDPDDQLFSPSVIEDVAFGPLNLGLGQKEALARARDVLDSLGILHLADRVPYELSGGEKKLVALATILSMRPRVLLLDEPLAGIEKKAMIRLLNVLKSFPLEGLMVISHLPDMLQEIAETVWLLKDGKIKKSSYLE